MLTKLSGWLSSTSTAWLPYWPMWLLACLLTRLPTTLHYIADPDSLRFALAVTDFDLANLQPHFPGYPVFCFLTKLLYLPIGRFAYAFSLAGALASFLLLLSGSYLCSRLLPAPARVIYLLLLFFCPMLWIMANRYMPDLLGCALVFACFAAYARARQSNQRWVVLFFVLAGLLAGVRLSYIPMVLVPAGLLVFYHPKRWHGLAAGVLAVLVWLVPMVVDTGWQNLLHVATTHTDGHFTQWGGTVISEPSHPQRLSRLLHFVWATGLGGYWSGRSMASALFSAALIVAALIWVVAKQSPKKISGGSAAPEAKHLLWVLLASGVVYLLWIYFYQNVVHQSRHVLPLLPLLLLLPAAGLASLLQHRAKWARVGGLVLAFLLLALNAWLTLNLVRQHQKPTAVFQALQHLRQPTVAPRVVATIDLMVYYLKAQQVPGEVLSVERDAGLIRQRLHQGREVVVMGDFNLFPDRSHTFSRTFYHNPYVNSLWPELTVYHYAP